MIDIHPTHTCFDDALDFLCAAIKKNPDAAYSNEFLLVHGICFAPSMGEYSHAWVEQDGRLVWTAGIIHGERIEYAVDLQEYYDQMNVKEKTKYTPRQAWLENRRYVTYGPWLEKYKNLCGRQTVSKNN